MDRTEVLSQIETTRDERGHRKGCLSARFLNAASPLALFARHMEGERPPTVEPEVSMAPATDFDVGTVFVPVGRLNDAQP